MQQASANVSDSFSFRFRQLFWSQRKAIRVQLTRPIHTKTQAGGGEESSTGARARTHMQHDCKSAQKQLGPLASCRHHFWKKKILFCAFHILLLVCVCWPRCVCSVASLSTPLSQEKSDIYMTCKVQPGQNLLSLFSFILQHKSKNIVSCIMQRRWNVFTTVQYFLKHLSSHCQLVLP